MFRLGLFSTASALRPVQRVVQLSTPLRFYSTHPEVTKDATTLASQPTVPIASQKQADLGYSVLRTDNMGLPVYTDFRNGRTRTLTIIRRIYGDREKLAQDLGANIPEEHISVRKATGHIWIKGNYRDEVLKFLTGKGF
ncbi:mitochondrial large ribosomal subunit [Dispira parvispora]|uniref:Large ribosomal subunit protein mL49 n=1 Tax=Dispira parvispora TaxID=1520584 RepID=A0A9W8ANY2_9FUNG|nr:mitochondrial large ribosomal subunit [Dispira parvispora]